MFVNAYTILEADTLLSDYFTKEGDAGAPENTFIFWASS